MSQKRPSGQIIVADEKSGLPEIVLNRETVKSLTSPLIKTVVGTAIGAVLAFAGTASVFYIQAQVHFQNKEIHIRGESKAESRRARERMVKDIADRQKVAIDGVRADTKKQIVDLGEKLHEEQRAILKEIVRTRRAAER